MSLAFVSSCNELDLWNNASIRGNNQALPESREETLGVDVKVACKRVSLQEHGKKRTFCEHYI